MNRLSDDLLLYILSKLKCTGDTWSRLPLVCKRWYRVCRRQRTCPSQQCHEHPHYSVMRALVEHDTQLLGHVWQDERLSRHTLYNNHWCVELLLTLHDMQRMHHIVRTLPQDVRDTLMHRACGSGRGDIVSLLLQHGYSKVDLFDFSQACHCLENNGNDGPFSVLLCEESVSQLLTDSVLVQSLTLHQHHSVIRWLLHWEPAFCTAQTLTTLFDYCMTSRQRVIARDIVTHTQCPWPLLKAEYITHLAAYGWHYTLHHYLQHVDQLKYGASATPMGNTNYMSRQHIVQLLKEALQSAVQAGHVKCVRIVHTHHKRWEPTLDNLECYHQAFRYVCIATHLSAAIVHSICQELVIHALIDLCRVARMPRQDIWISLVIGRRWTTLQWLLQHHGTRWDTNPFASNHAILRHIMATCPPYRNHIHRHEQDNVANVLATFAQHPSLTASNEEMLKLILYAKETQHAALKHALYTSPHVQRIMHNLFTTTPTTLTNPRKRLRFTPE